MSFIPQQMHSCAGRSFGVNAEGIRASSMLSICVRTIAALCMISFAFYSPIGISILRFQARTVKSWTNAGS